MCKKVKQSKVSASVNNISNVLEKSGRYQLWQNVTVCLPAVFVSMLNINYVFVAGHVNHRCRVSECEASVPEFSPSWWPTTSMDCYRPVLNTTVFALDSVCTNNSFTNDFEKCSDLVYESDDTVVSQFNLGCQPWKVNFIGTIHGLGTIVAMIASGWMCDRFGRKPTFILGAVACIIGNLKILSKSYNFYIFVEFLEGALTLGAYTAGSVIMSENSTQKSRVMSGVMFAYAIYMGEVLFACMAMNVHYWKHLLAIICTPPTLFLSHIYLLNESPRWLILHGKITEARETLQQIVKTNNLELNPKEIDNITDVELRKCFNLDKTETREGLREMFKSKEIVKRLVAGIVWRLAVSFIYYSLVVNSVLLPGDKYTNFLMTALTSFPGELLSMYFLNKIGRRLPLIIGFLMCGVTCIASSYVPDSYQWIKIALFLLGKLLISACFTGCVVYSMELFPTSVRGLCIGLCTLATCVGTMLAPLTPALTQISPVLTSLCYACFAVVAAALIRITPETKGLPLMDTIEQVILHKNISKPAKDTNAKTSILQHNMCFNNDEITRV